MPSIFGQNAYEVSLICAGRFRYIDRCDRATAPEVKEVNMIHGEYVSSIPYHKYGTIFGLQTSTRHWICWYNSLSNTFITSAWPEHFPIFLTP